MSKILLQTTITEHSDDWDVTRFSLLADELRAAGHQVTARNRFTRGEDDPILSRLDELDYDQLWLLAVDIGDGLTDAESQAIVRFRENGGGVLTARDHQDLGSCLIGLGSLGEVSRTDSGRIEWFPAHPHPAGASASLLRSTASAARMGRRWVARWPTRRFTTSPTTTGISTAVHPPSSPSRRAQRSRQTRRAW